MIDFTDDQKKAIAAAQEKFTDLKDKVDSLSDCLLYTSPSPRDCQ